MTTLSMYAKEFNLPVRALHMYYADVLGELKPDVVDLFDRYREFTSVVSEYVTVAEWNEICSTGVMSDSFRELLASIEVRGYSAKDITELVFGVLKIQAVCFFSKEIPDNYSEITTKLLGMTVKEIILCCDALAYQIEVLKDTPLNRFVALVSSWFLAGGFVPQGLTKERLITLSRYTDYVADWYVEHTEEEEYE